MSTSALTYEAQGPAQGFSGRTWPLLLSIYGLICSGAVLLAVTEMTFTYALAAVVFCAGHALICGPDGRTLVSPRAVQILGVAALLFCLLHVQFINAHMSYGLAHFLVLVQLIMLYGLRNMRDIRLMQVTVIFELLIAAIWALEIVYLPAFILAASSLVLNMIVVEMHRTETGTGARRVVPSLRDILLAFWLPALLILAVTVSGFIALPRLSWAANRRQSFGALMTGFSENVSLQEVGSLRQSDELVFSAKFSLMTPDRAVPFTPRRVLMRGVSLPVYDNGQWLGHGHAMQQIVRRRLRGSRRGHEMFESEETYLLDDSGVSVRRVLQRVQLHEEPSNVLFALYRPVEVLGSDYERTVQPISHHVLASLPEEGRPRYSVISWVPEFTQDQLREADCPEPTPPWLVYWEVPDEIRPVLEQTAREIDRLYAPETDYDRLASAQRYLLNPERFTYTLELPAFGRQDPIVAFLTETKRGSCEQFSTALALIARMWSIPTRLVVGFKEGTINAETKRYTFRDKDAHAWVEAYFDGLGWVEFDPTPGARIELDGSASDQGLFDAFTGRVDREVYRLRRLIQGTWSGSIIGYSRFQQRQLFRSVLQTARDLARDSETVFRTLVPGMPSFGVFQVVMLVLLFTLVVMLLYLLGRWLEARLGWSGFGPRKKTLRFYEELLGILRRKGIDRPDSATARELARRAAAQLAESNEDASSLRRAIELVTEQYCRVRFGQHEPSDEEKEQVQAALKTLSKARRATTA